MSNSLTTEQVVQSAPGKDLAVEKRSIQMRMFKSKTNIKLCVDQQIIVPLGQIAGVIYDVVEKPGTLPNGEPKTSLLALGDFQAVNYETGEVTEAKAAYLPGYFAEALRALFVRAGAKVIQCGIEVVAEPTGLDEKTNLPKSIPFAYGVRNLMARRADDPLEQVKRAMQGRNMLRLPVPEPVSEQKALPLNERGEYFDPAGDAYNGGMVDHIHDNGTQNDDDDAGAALAEANPAVDAGPRSKRQRG